MIIAEYFWLDVNSHFRSKIRVVKDKENITEWNYDGSSTGQATTESSEIILKPVKYYNHPLIDNGYLVVCATYNINNEPLPNNHYHNANIIFNNNNDHQNDDHHSDDPWFGLEQEFFLIKKNQVLGYTDNIVQGKYYCSHTNQDQLGHTIMMEHLNACIKANINISGINAEVAPSQWEFQIGPCEGIDIGNQMMAARFLLERIAIKYDVHIDYNPKPFNYLNGSGCHTNFSTKQMREDENGYDVILKAINKLELNHDLHMKNYGEDNNKRMTGHHETASFDNFSYGIGTRNTSIRIGYETFKNKKGYFEDRRPAANCDPYLVTSLIYKTINN